MPRWPFGKNDQDDPLIELFERVYQFRNSETLQNERLPDGFRETVQNAASVDRNDPVFGPFGQALTNPIPVNGPIGEIVYLSDLRHRSGMPIVFHRLGSIFKTDVYEVVTIDCRFWDVIYLDMYHPRKSHLAPNGYNICSTTNSERYLFRGMNSFLPRFPKGIYDAVVTDSKARFGISLADPALKVIETDSAISRPRRHALFLETLTVHGLELSKDAPIEQGCATVALDLASGIEGVIYRLEEEFRSIGELREKPNVNHKEVLYFSVCAVVVLILAVSGVANADRLADATIARALSIQRGDAASVLEFRSRFERYNNRFWQFFTEPSDYEPLLKDALISMVGKANELDVNIFGGYFVNLLAEAGKAVREAVG